MTATLAAGLLAAAISRGSFAFAVGPDDKAVPAGLPPGAPRMWEDRGKVTPRDVFWGPAAQEADPLSRLPRGPFTNFEKDTTHNARTPKGKVVDRNGVKWTIKLGEEVHSDIVAPRLAWALGFHAIESYYVPAGRVEGITMQTDLGRAKGWILPDGSFKGGARFKRKDEFEIENAKGADINWELRRNPGVPAEHLSALRLFNVLINNWDVAPKNCKVTRVEGENGPENWFYVSDLGGSLAGGRWGKFNVAEFERDFTFIKEVKGDDLILDFRSAIHAQGQEKAHQRIPAAHVHWFVARLDKLTDAHLTAAFDAAFATAALHKAYASGDMAEVEKVRMQELSAETRQVIQRFVAKMRSRIAELRIAAKSAREEVGGERSAL